MRHVLIPSAAVLAGVWLVSSASFRHLPAARQTATIGVILGVLAALHLYLNLRAKRRSAPAASRHTRPFTYTRKP